MQQLYSLALAEGEGLGTAYEYFVKLRLLDRLVKGRPRDVLIYGLPEKHGFSLDLLYFCHKHGLKAFLFEQRVEKRLKLNAILDNLKKNGVIINKPEPIDKIDKKFDLVLSCEVLQALGGDELKSYVNNVQKYARKAVLFMPNKSNKDHARFSGLNGFTLEELNDLFDNVKKSGYIDAPPFPPGIKKYKKIKNIFLIRTLTIFGLMERFFPIGIKKKIAHIVFILLDNS